MRVLGVPQFLKRDRLTVHLHALCWNEARLLPYFFRHYDRVVDRYFVYDNGSTDGSLQLLERHPRVVLSTFTFGESFVQAATEHYNQCWKQSRGQADWVFIVNIDEHLYHPHVLEYLRACRRHGVTVILPEGYNMISDTFPTKVKPLWKTIRYGARDSIWDKAEFFNPNRIEEINFSPGRHGISPSGDVAYPRSVRTKLLHFKYLGADYLVERHAELASKIPSQDFARGWAYQYTWDRERNLEELQRCRTNAVRVV